MNAKIPNQTRRSIYRRDGWRCALCDNSQSIQIHHAIPRGKGGSNSPHNLITLCSVCHAQAHGITACPDISPEYVEQAAIEYLADMYAENEWNPWKPEWEPWRRE